MASFTTFTVVQFSSFLTNFEPSIDGTASCIRKPTVQANNFELKPSYVNMIQNLVQFHGLPSENPNLHIAYFLDICDMFRVNDVPDDAIRLRLFPFSLKR